MEIRLNIKLLLFVAVVVITLGLNVGCKKSSPPTPKAAANEVLIENMAFGPADLTVPLNTTVKWTNKDTDPHTVSSDSLLFDSGSIPGGGTYSRQFTTAGTFPYRCSIHPSMKAKVIVN